MTEILRESHSCINVHTVTIPYDSVFFTQIFCDCVAGETTLTPLLENFSCVMGDSRLLPGGPSRSEGSRVPTKVLSSC